MNAPQAHRVDEAYKAVVDHFLTDVINQANYTARLFEDLSNPGPPMAQYLASTCKVLDLIDLQELLGMNEHDVIKWASELPEMATLMHEHDLRLKRVEGVSQPNNGPLLGLVMNEPTEWIE